MGSFSVASIVLLHSPTDFDSDSDLEACQLRKRALVMLYLLFIEYDPLHTVTHVQSSCVLCSVLPPLMLHSAAVYECFAHCVACRSAACFTTMDHQTRRP